jgi:Fungal trichothecene efflux pump (TRI12)
MSCVLTDFSWPTWYSWWPLDRRGIDSICQLEMVYVLPYLQRLLLTLPGFYINLPVGAVSAILLFVIHIPDRLGKSRRAKPSILETLSKLDIGGFVLFAPCAIMFLMALQWGGTKYAWNSATVIGLLCGAGGLFIVFTAWEYRLGDKAMIPPSMLGKRVVWSSCLVTAFFFGGLLIFSYYLPIYFQSVKGTSPSSSGVYILPGILSQMLMAVISGILGEFSSGRDQDWDR